MINRLKNNKGNTSPLFLVLLFMICLFASIIMEYAKSYTIIHLVQNSLDTATLTVSTENAPEIYNGLREGHTGGYNLDTPTPVVKVVKKTLFEYLEISLNVKSVDGKLVKQTASKNTVFFLSNFTFNVIPTEYAPKSKNATFTANISCKLTIPFNDFFGNFKLEIPIKSHAEYIRVF